MTGILQPLDNKFAIVDRHGNPTDYFIRWAQQKQIDIGSSITLTDLANYLAAHKLASGQGIALTPDGNLADSPSISILNGTGLDFDVMHNLKLADTAVVPGTYGDATHVPAIVVDQQGRITGVTLVAISGGGGGITTIGAPGGSLTATLATGTVNFYVMLRVFADTNITINKIGFMCSTSTPTAKFQAFVYNCSVATVGGALIASSVQNTGAVAGYNEIALSSSAALLKGNFYLLGVNVITASIANMFQVGAGVGAFAANGGSSIPAGTCPALTTGGAGLYGFWGIT